MGRRVRFKGAKNTPKKLERELLDLSANLAEHPELLIPKCQGDCRKCEFEKLLKKMEKVARYKDDPDRLTALASKGDQFVRAYAAAISLSAAGSIPYLGTAKLPTGEVSYAVRGKVDNKMLIAAQHHDDPDLRLLLYWDMARERDLHLYALEDGTVCSDRPKAPKGYVEEALRSAHYGEGEMKGEGTRLEIEWLSAGVTLSINEERLQSKNLLVHLAGRIAARDRFDDFKVAVRHDLKGGTKWKDLPLSDALLAKYKDGLIGDRELVGEHIAEKREKIKASGEAAYVIGDRMYDAEAFIASLRGGRHEIEAVRAALRGPKAVVLEGDRASEAIAELWDGSAREMLSAVSNDAIAEEIIGKRLSPAQAVAEANRRHSESTILSDLPSYPSLGEVASLADAVAREYKVRGTEDTVRAIERLKPAGHRLRAVSRGFLIALGNTGGWQFSREEEEFGTYLSAFARVLLDSVGEEYDSSLRNLVTASGSNENVPQPNRA